MADCRLIKSGDSFEGATGLSYFSGIAAETVGAKGICMHIVEIPAGARAKAHFHADHETAVYMLEGETDMRWGARLEHTIHMAAGDLLYIPAGVPHLPYNDSAMPARAVLARTDPQVMESIVLCPELDEPTEV
jgi:uncharacterized RmlC-like cupin family protein